MSLFRRLPLAGKSSYRTIGCGDPCQRAAAAPQTGKKKDELDLSFSDPVASFKSKTTWELVRALIVYNLCSVDWIVNNNKFLMKKSEQILGQKLFEKLMKATFYGQFVAGEDQIRIRPVVDRLASFGVKSILDYSVEEDITEEEAVKREVQASTSETASGGGGQVGGDMKQFQVDRKFADRRMRVYSARTFFYLNESTCEKNMEHFLRSAEAVAGATNSTGLMAVKLTALGRPQLLLQLSEVIMRARKYMQEIAEAKGQGNVLTHHKTMDDVKRYFSSDMANKPEVQEFLKKMTSDKEGIVHLFPWSLILDEHAGLSDSFRVPDPKTGQMRRLISQIAPKEEEMFRNMLRRLNQTIKAAEELNVRMMVDAEQTYFQPAISRITLEMMAKYNKEKAIVYNTYQCYLKSTYNELVTDIEQAKRQNFHWAAKLVRGAYIEQERARAAEMGYPDPTNENVEATTAMYHKCMTEVLNRVKSPEHKGRVGVMVASHNEDTVRYAIKTMNELGITPEQKVVCFGQLLGMCDNVTFPLGQSGYSVYKYVPYGPVREVLPYLSRRADENRGFLSKIKKEKRLLWTELFRRARSGQLNYTPRGDYTPI